jgi:hypothetical protein
VSRAHPFGWIGIAALLACSTCCNADGEAPLVGTWQGGGRACSGTLTINARTLSWKTAFVRCEIMSYRVTALGEPDTALQQRLYRLQGAQPTCLFQSLVLTRPTLAGGEPNWEVVAFRTDADRLAGRMDDAMACPLVRLK